MFQTFRSGKNASEKSSPSTTLGDNINNVIEFIISDQILFYLSSITKEKKVPVIFLRSNLVIVDPII